MPFVLRDCFVDPINPSLVAKESAVREIGQESSQENADDEYGKANSSKYSAHCFLAKSSSDAMTVREREAEEVGRMPHTPSHFATKTNQTTAADHKKIAIVQTPKINCLKTRPSPLRARRADASMPISIETKRETKGRNQNIASQRFPPSSEKGRTSRTQ